ncbi:MAG: adenylosuccinate lyase [Nanoarchaeota archaeon]
MNEKTIYFNSLKNFTAAEGRHCLITAPLREYFSEHALHKYRALVEIKHLIKMSKNPEFKLPALTPEDQQELMNLFEQFDESGSQAIAEYDHFGRNNIGPTEHDVKSVELYLAEKLKCTKYNYLIPWIHFGFTSEDVNNIAYNCMLKEGLEKVWYPQLIELCNHLKELSLEQKDTPLLSRTHGQPASPTTFGKEMAVFLQRFTNEIKELKKIKLSSKMNGAVGNYNAHIVSHPKVDWIKYSQEFVEEFGFDVELLTNQRGPKNKIVQLFQTIMRANNILKDFNIDLWLYVSKDLVLQRKVPTHVGSSVMPHKINPWLIECSEGNIEVSNALLEVFCRELEVSRLQRDLSDHDLERNYGTALSYSLVAFNYSTNFLGMVYVNKDLMLHELKENQKIMSEAYQTILRAKGCADAYNLFKDQFRENFQPDQQKINEIIDQMEIDEETKLQLKSLKVEEYLGETEKLVKIAIKNYNELDFNWA